MPVFIMKSNHLQYGNLIFTCYGYLGMQLGTDLSTSHVENNFIGTGFTFVAKYNFPPPSAAIFSVNIY